MLEEMQDLKVIKKQAHFSLTWRGDQSSLSHGLGEMNAIRKTQKL